MLVLRLAAHCQAYLDSLYRCLVGNLRIELRLPVSRTGWLPTPPFPIVRALVSLMMLPRARSEDGCGTVNRTQITELMRLARKPSLPARNIRGLLLGQQASLAMVLSVRFELTNPSQALVSKTSVFASFTTKGWTCERELNPRNPLCRQVHYHSGIACL